MNRIKQREHIFKLIFSFPFGSEEEFFAGIENKLNEIETDDTESLAYIEEKSKGIINHLEEIDTMINATSKNWTVARMAKVELAIIRLATYEILYEETIPDSVSVNEAVELAKKFGGDNAPSFVNGVLGSVIKKNEKIGNE